MTHTATQSSPHPVHRPPTLEQLLEQARQRIQVSEEELSEARARRDLLGRALLREFPGSEVYLNGSVAHGDALNPLTDIDLGVIVAGAEDTHGPGCKGPADLQERAANAIRTELAPHYPELRVEWRGRKRSILVRFGDPVAAGTGDFTADVIVAVDNPDGEGLYIPRFQYWDRAHPQKHTELVKAANKATSSGYARTVRLLKHWNRRNQRPLCSWNVKALGLGCLTRRKPLLTGLRDWFAYAIEELAEGLTEDPARVAEKPIKVNEDVTRTGVVDRLKAAASKLERSVEFEDAGYPLLAHEALAKFFNDPEMLPFPDEFAVRAEADRKFLADQRRTRPTGSAGAAAVTTIGATPRAGGKDVRSWAP